jgi:hypothetical protein
MPGRPSNSPAPPMFWDSACRVSGVANDDNKAAAPLRSTRHVVLISPNQTAMFSLDYLDR